MANFSVIFLIFLDSKQGWVSILRCASWSDIVSKRRTLTYFRDLAEGAVMEREGAGHPLIWSACALLSNAGYAALDEARHSGMLLYAWCGTTFFDQPTARH
jgi:hypothetical protein